MLARLQHSLSTKLLALFICAGAVLLLLVGSIMGRGFSLHLKSGLEPFMVHYIELMHKQLGSPPDPVNARKITINTPVDIHVFHPDEEWSTAETIINRDQLIDTYNTLNGNNDSQYKLHRKSQQVILQTMDGDYQIYFQINDTGDIQQETKYSLIVLCLIVGILILIYFATRTIFQPIEDIEKGVKLYGEGNLNHKISKQRNDQLGDLIDSVNKMAGDISRMLEAKRQFLLGISHELRSPLTRCKVNLALMDESSVKTEINDDIESMDGLIEELLESERLNSPHRVIQPEETDIHLLITELVESEFCDYNIKLKLDSLTASIDPARVRLLLRNLLQNSIKYNNKSKENNKPVKLKLKRHSDHFIISVRDYGKGIDKQHIPFLTEPFYRADPSKQRLTGGYGLGLYLCKMIMRAHSGQLNIESKPGNGTRITCRFPY